MNFAGTVWRIVPANAFALHVGYILRARGRWNREGVYGCLYTALTAEGALAEWAKYLRAAGLPPEASAARDLVSLDLRVDPVLDLTSASVRRGLGVHLATITGDAPEDLEVCRSIADLGRQQGYVGILSPSAALRGSSNLNLYIDGQADRYVLEVGADRVRVTPQMLRGFF
ncbi:MAG TPA: RES family NAD+ phosphorylase [Longimicrobiaceae bacterium]|nr:RES family NAD+ phosphorylase [Longimicrobiaceae bacterium]